MDQQADAAELEGADLSSGAALANTRKKPASLAPLIQHLLPLSTQHPLPKS
jgi:hypothetical protein